MGSFTKKEQIAILIIVLFIIFAMGIKFILDDLKTPTPMNSLAQTDLIEEDTKSEEEEDFEEDNSLIMVYISGQVYSPGVYELVTGDRVKDVVELAGGLTKEADLNSINLAKKISDEEKIHIPKQGEENIYIGQMAESTMSQTSNSSKININVCSNSELESLPGIGSVIADRIIEYRKSTPFNKIEELKNVSGIGDKKFESIKDLITVN